MFEEGSFDAFDTIINIKSQVITDNDIVLTHSSHKCLLFAALELKITIGSIGRADKICWMQSVVDATVLSFAAL